MGLKNHLFRRASLLLVVMFVFVGIFSLTSLVQAAPGDVLYKYLPRKIAAVARTAAGTAQPAQKRKRPHRLNLAAVDQTGVNSALFYAQHYVFSNLAISFCRYAHSSKSRNKPRLSKK